MIQTARGKFSNGWVAVFQGKHGTYYGYGYTEAEAKQDVLQKVEPDENLESEIRIRETHLHSSM